VRKPAEETEIWKEVIDSLIPYRSVLEWAFHQSMSEVTNVDVAAHWHEHYSGQVGTANENTLKDAAVCFFNVCQGALLGKMVVGRRGQATRLQTSTSELKSFIEAGPTTLPVSVAEMEVTKPIVLPDQPADATPASSSETNTNAATPVQQTQPPLRIFITHGKNMTLVEQVQTMLGLGGFESEVAEDEETTAIPVPEKVFSAMRRCQAGIIVVSADEASKTGDKYFVNENVLIEIGAAFVLYDRRVVLVWDKRLKVPSNLQGLYRCEFEGEEFSWSAGMKLMKAIKDFKR
jgi:predicted nucleotide-binding protein